MATQTDTALPSNLPTFHLATSMKKKYLDQAYCHHSHWKDQVETTKKDAQTQAPTSGSHVPFLLTATEELIGNHQDTGKWN